MSNYKKPYALRVNEACFEKLKAIAEVNHRSVNAQIEYLIEKCIKEYEAENSEVKTSV